MESHGTVTYWLNRLKSGDELAAQKLWEAYCEQMVALALRVLGEAARRSIDEHDVVNDAFHNFLTAVGCGRFPRLDDRNDLWQVLIWVTRCKAINERKRQHRENVRLPLVGESVLAGYSSIGYRGIEQVIDAEPTPAEAAQFLESFRRRLNDLPADLHELALLKLEGYTVTEIAARLQCVPRTIERRLQRIRSVWSKDLER